MNKKHLSLATVAHFASDIYPGSVPAVLPVLVRSLQLSYTEASLVITVLNVSASVLQLPFGLLADRLRRAWLMPAGLLIAAVCFALVSIAASYSLVLALVVLGGAGVACFHPAGAKAAYRASGAGNAFGMSIFNVGGNLAFSVGPLGIAALLVLGPERALLWMVPGLLVVLLLLPAVARAEVVEGPRSAPRSGGLVPPERRWAILLLFAMAIGRGISQHGVLTLVPLYAVYHLGGTPFDGARLIFWFMFAGTLSTPLMGLAADRWGRKPVLIGSLFLQTPFLAGLLLFPAPWRDLSLAVAGFILVPTPAIFMVMAQELLPRNVGLASALMHGVAVGLGGLGVAVLGNLADHYGLPTALAIATLVPTVAGLLGFWLPARPAQLAAVSYQPSASEAR